MKAVESNNIQVYEPQRQKHAPDSDQPVHILHIRFLTLRFRCVSVSLLIDCVMLIYCEMVIYWTKVNNVLSETNQNTEQTIVNITYS